MKIYLKNMSFFEKISLTGLNFYVSMDDALLWLSDLNSDYYTKTRPRGESSKWKKIESIQRNLVK